MTVRPLRIPFRIHQRVESKVRFELQRNWQEIEKWSRSLGGVGSDFDCIVDHALTQNDVDNQEFKSFADAFTLATRQDPSALRVFFRSDVGSETVVTPSSLTYLYVRGKGGGKEFLDSSGSGPTGGFTFQAGPGTTSLNLYLENIAFRSFLNFDSGSTSSGGSGMSTVLDQVYVAGITNLQAASANTQTRFWIRDCALIGGMTHAASAHFTRPALHILADSFIRTGSSTFTWNLYATDVVSGGRDTVITGNYIQTSGALSWSFTGTGGSSASQPSFLCAGNTFEGACTITVANTTSATESRVVFASNDGTSLITSFTAKSVAVVGNTATTFRTAIAWADRAVVSGNNGATFLVDVGSQAGDTTVPYVTVANNTGSASIDAATPMIRVWTKGIGTSGMTHAVVAITGNSLSNAGGTSDPGAARYLIEAGAVSPGAYMLVAVTGNSLTYTGAASCSGLHANYRAVHVLSNAIAGSTCTSNAYCVGTQLTDDSGNVLTVSSHTHPAGDATTLDGLDSTAFIQHAVADAKGDLLAASAPDTFVRLAVGADGQILTADAAEAAGVKWAAAPAGYTDEQAQDAVGSILTDSATVDFTYDDAAGTITAIVQPGSIGIGHLDFDPATQAELDAHTHPSDHAHSYTANHVLFAAADGSITTDAALTFNPGTDTLSTTLLAVTQRAVIGDAIGAQVLDLKAGAAEDHVYMAFYARSATPSTRSGYLGYGSIATLNMNLMNQLAGSLVFGTSNTNRWSISNNGHLLSQADSTYDIGSSGASRPRDIHVARAVGIGLTASSGVPLRVVAGTTASIDVGAGSDGTTAAAGLAFGSSRDTNLYRAAADLLQSDDNIRSSRALAADHAHSAIVAGDGVNRWVVQADGKLEWGTGAVARDTNLYRSAADTLRTDDLFVANQLQSVVATGTSPLVVASTTLVTNLNVDLLDGSHASAFALSGHAHPAGDADTLDGIDSTGFALAAHAHDATYVNANGDTMTGVLLLPDGAVGAPALANDGDTDTGIYFSADDEISLAGGGTALARSSPTAYLHVSPTADNTAAAAGITFGLSADTGVHRKGNGVWVGVGIQAQSRETLASAATISPATNAVTITGTTTIDIIANSAARAGSVIYLIFASNPVVRHNGGGTGNIRLRGSVNWTASTNAVLGLISDGTNWFQLTREPN